MNCYKNLYILGTSHISKSSADKVKSFIENDKPDIIAIELDRKRFHALSNGSISKPSIKDMISIGFKPFLINLIGSYAEKKLGKIVGVNPGSEMKKAIEMAKKHNMKIGLIDQDINITMKKLSKEITLKVIFKFLQEVVMAVIFRKKNFETFDISKVPSQGVIKNILSKVKEIYPGIYKVLIEERNEIMAKNLYNLMNRYNDKKIFAVVGAGHEFEIINILKRAEA